MEGDTAEEHKPRRRDAGCWTSPTRGTGVRAGRVFFFFTCFLQKG